MDSLITKTTFLVLLPMMSFLSFATLFRGHDKPGGGFAGGLLAALALILFVMLYQRGDYKLMFVRLFPQLLASGLGIMLSCAILPLFFGQSFLEGIWSPLVIPGVGKLSTVLFFDIGLFIVVTACSLFVLIRLDEG